jgi:hypothetical protein
MHPKAKRAEVSLAHDPQATVEGNGRNGLARNNADHAQT